MEKNNETTWEQKNSLEFSLEASKLLEIAAKELQQDLQPVAKRRLEHFVARSSRRLDPFIFKTAAGGELKLETLEDMEDDWTQHGSFDEIVAGSLKTLILNLLDTSNNLLI